MRPLRKSLITVIALFAVQILSGQTVTTTSLIGELTDLQQLAQFPEQGYTTIQYSSYDRRTVSADKPGWFANSDGFGGEPIPGFLEVIRKPGADKIGEYLICDVKGPGAIVRMWTAMITGEITLWLDQQKEPVYQGPAQFFMQHTYEALLKQEARPAWNTTLSQNMASYYPIPFAKGCRMVWKGDLNTLHFYHVQVRQYVPDTKVKTLTIKDVSDNQVLLDKSAAILAKPFDNLDSVLFNAAYSVEWLKPGEKKTVKKIVGQEAIKRLAVFVTAQNLEKALRQTVLEIRFDGAPWGQVQSPIGDFFGAAPGINPYESLPFTVFPDGRMVCRYFMPFRDSAEILVENFGDQEVTVTCKVLSVPNSWTEGKSMHFRARWRVDHELLADPRQVKDLPYLMLRGKGRMVGAACYLMNPTSVPSSSGNWWGEGDEKIFVDNNLSPIFIGTGSEDYYNYAWSEEALFATAYGGQPRNDGPANRGFVTNYRWHILDNILFQNNFDFYMELYSHRVVPHFSYARMIYTYAMPGCHDDHIPLSADDLRFLKMPAVWLPEGQGQSSNSIFYQVEDLVTDATQLKLVASPQWAATHLAVWNPKGIDDKLILLVPAAKSGKYMIGFTVGKMAGSGKIKILMDGKVLKFNGNEIQDLSTGFQPVARNLNSDPIELSEGIHVVTILPAEGAGKSLGMDFLWVKAL